jgi:hypothetical protein
MNLPDTLLCPFQITLRLFRSFEALRKVCANTLKASLGESLQLEELALLSIELTGSIFQLVVRHPQQMADPISLEK